MAPPMPSTGNRILDRLPGEEADLLLSFAKPTSIQRGNQVFAQNSPMTHAYFPTTGVFGVVLCLGEGRQIEAATVSSEGMIGVTLALGLDFCPEAVLSQVTGEALRVPADRLQSAAKPGSTLDRLLRRYAAYRLRVTSQAVACHCLHSLEERMCRWLLVAHDRAGTEEFEMTHEFLAERGKTRSFHVASSASRVSQSSPSTFARATARSSSGRHSTASAA